MTHVHDMSGSPDRPSILGAVWADDPCEPARTATHPTYWPHIGPPPWTVDENLVTIVAMIGAPGSGKTTLARAEAVSLTSAGYRTVIVSRDDIRARHGLHYGTDEAAVTAIHNAHVKRLAGAITGTTRTGGRRIPAGHAVDVIILDQTHAKPEHLEESAILARTAGHRLHTWIVPTLLTTCLARNAERTGPARVPDDVVKTMWERIRHDHPTPAPEGNTP